jgi:hypothetical protein
VAIRAALRVMPAASTARETAQPAEASEGEAARRRSGGGQAQQQQRAAGKQRTAAGRCEREQIARIANAAREERPANGYELRRACAELCVGIEDIRERLSWALNGGSAEAIKSHCKALLSEVERIEGAAAREAQTRGWDLNEIKDLMRRMLAETQCTLRAADSTLCEWKAAHHAARVEDLAGEASEVGGTECWSRQDCTVFREELEWELQAFHGANAELELLALPTHKRQAAHLRAVRVDDAGHYARHVVKRVLWDHDNGWEEPQRFGLDHHQPIHPEESCGQGGRRGVQAGSVAGETEDASGELLQSEPADLARHWPGETEDASEELPLTAQEPGEEAGRPRAEAGHSEAWASRPADLPRHWLGGTEDALEELLPTAQRPGEEAGPPRLHGESSEAPRELVFQHGEHEGSSELGSGNSSRTRQHADLHRSEDRHKEAGEAERPQPHEASSGAPREQALQGGEREGWPDGCRRAKHQVDLSRRAGTAVSKKRRLPSGSERWRAGTAVSKKRRLPSGSERWREAKRRPAQRLSCEARTHGLVCRREAAAEAAQGEQSGCQEDATPTAAGKGESGDESDLLTEDRDRAGLRGSANQGSRGSQGWDPGGLLMGA